MKQKLIGSNSNGKVVIAAAVTTVGLFAVNYVPDTFGVQYYKKFMQFYKKAEPVPVSPKVVERFDRAVDLCEMEEHERQIVKPFYVVGLDVAIVGTTKSRFGANVGIPVNYEYDSISDIKRNELRFRNQEINWNSESGKFLEESLVLTEDEQTFGLCKGLLQLNTHYVLLNSIFPSVSFMTVYTLGHYLNASLGLLARPFAVRLVLYMILGLFGAGSWCFMKDFNQVSLDAEIDKKISAMGPRFVQAGIGFYDKQLKKNMALRNLLNDNTFTAKGNFNYLIRQQSLPLTIRKSYFESLVEEAANEKVLASN